MILPALDPLLSSGHLPAGDVLQLAATCRVVQRAVHLAWRPRCIRALIAASASDRLLLVQPLTGEVLLTASASAPDGQGGSWAPCVEVDAASNRCFVSQYEGPCVLEYSLPDLVLRRCMSGQQLTGGGGAEEPEGLVCAEGSLYVAWLDSMAVSSTPLEALPPAGQGAAGALAPANTAAPSAAPEAAPEGRSPLAGGRQRMQRRPPGRAQWVMWGMRRGPDGALYVSCNPPYFVEGQRYSDVPAAAGRGFVACLALGEGGELRGRMRRFTQGLLLSRPSGLCFDDAGDLYVTHMGGQVVKFSGPQRGPAAGQPLGVFIDCLLPQHGLSPAPQASRPCPMDIAFCEGLFFLTSHACEEAGEPSHGRLTVWDRQGALLASHALGPAWRHPNGLAVFCQ